MSKSSRLRNRQERRKRDEKRAKNMGITLPIVQTASATAVISTESTWLPDFHEMRPDDPTFLKILKSLMSVFWILRSFYDDFLRFDILRPIVTLVLLATVIDPVLIWADKVLVFLDLNSAKILYIPYEVASYFTSLYTSIENLTLFGEPVILKILTFILATEILTHLWNLKELEKNLYKNLFSMLRMYAVLYVNSKYVFGGKEFVFSFVIMHVTLIPIMLEINLYKHKLKLQENKSKKQKAKK